MTLNDWLNKNGFTERAAEVVLGVPQTTINYVRNGRAPSLLTALKIQVNTKGAVKAWEFLTPNERRELYGEKGRP